MPISISWSALRVHEDCRQKATLIRQRKKDPLQDIRNYFHGNVVDRIMRAWLEDEDRQPGEMATQVEDFFVSLQAEFLEDGSGVVKWRGKNDRQVTANFCRVLLERLEPMLVEHVLPYEFQPEMRFRKVPLSIPYLNGEPAVIHLAGGIDILVRHAEGQCGCPAGGHEHPVWIGIDLKGTANPQYIRKVLGQARFYDLAIECMFEQPTTDFLFFQPMVEAAPIVSAQITDDHRADIATRITRMAHDMWNKDTSVKPTTGGCNSCEVKHACIRFKPVGGAKTVNIERAPVQKP